MTSVQKIIKNIALALAVFLIVSIISGILSALYALSGVLGLKNEDTKINNEMFAYVMRFLIWSVENDSENK